MREMILNHASLLAPDGDRGKVADWLRQLAAGMSQLFNDRVVRFLRTHKPPEELLCLANYSLADAYQDLRRSGYHEEYRFLVTLHLKTPLLHEIGEQVKDRFLACEEKMLPPGDGDPLVLCAIDDGIAVGFPSAPTWDRDRITVRFNQMLADQTIVEESEEIDQLTRPAHADPICERHRERLLAGSDPSTLWEKRETVFPHLVFGPGVENNLRERANLLPTIVGKLKDLDRSAQEWRNDPRLRRPPWRTKVTPESDSVMNHPRLQERRKFQSHLGGQELFEWHARFGAGGRIHLRFDPASKEVEIGYIGPHLPL